MKITVQYTTQLRTAMGRAEEVIETDAEDSERDFTVQDLLLKLAASNAEHFERLVIDAQRQLLPNMLVTVNDQQVGSPSEHSLNDGDTVLLLSTISGG